MGYFHSNELAVSLAQERTVEIESIPVIHMQH